MFELLDETSEITLSSDLGPAPRTKKGQRVKVNTVAGKRRAEEVKGRVPPVPDGVTLDSDRERLLWDQITAARLYDDWRTYDLLIVGEIIKLQSKMDDLQAVLDVEGYTREGRGGTEVVHPALTAWKSLDTARMRKAASISLGSVGGLDLNRRAIKEGPKSKHSKSNVASLLAA